MDDEYILKHLQDVLDAIDELESFFTDYPKRFDVFYGAQNEAFIDEVGGFE